MNMAMACVVKIRPVGDTVLNFRQTHGLGQEHMAVF